MEEQPAFFIDGAQGGRAMIEYLAELALVLTNLCRSGRHLA